MKTVLICGTDHKGTTYRIARMLADRLGGETEEFFLPRDFSPYCVGCGKCFLESEEKCPHYEAQREILRAMDAADVLLLASPVYVYHVTAPMKNFLDHLGYRWMVHRPRAAMFRKQAVCITTAAGAGMKSASRDLEDSLFFWGVPRVYRLGEAVHSLTWERVKEKKKAQIEKKIPRLAEKIRAGAGKTRPGLRTRLFFELMRMLQKRRGSSTADGVWWQEHGWLGKKRPWDEGKNTEG